MSVTADSLESMSAELKLDRWQQAVCAIPAGRSALVVGAPGTGKTTALMHYARTLIERDGLDTDQLLVLSPTRQSAAALREPLALAIGRTSEGPLVRSANSVAFEIVSTASGQTATLLTGSEHDQIIAELLAGEIADGTDGYWPESLSPELRGLRSFRAELREFMMRCEERGIRPERIEQLSADVPARLAVARFIRRYEQAKTPAYQHQYDSAELVSYAASLLAQSAEVFARTRVILIDDAQEATASTIALLRAFAGRGVGIIAFGDPDVSSSGFRGGHADLIGNFESLFAPPQRAGLVACEPLGQSYRMGAGLVEPYAALVEAIGTAGEFRQRRPRELQAQLGTVRRALAPSKYAQARIIADQLRELHLTQQAAWADCVVVTRSAGAAQSLESQLGRLGIPTRRTVSQLVLRAEPGAAWLLHAAELAYRGDPFDSASAEHAALAAELLSSPLGGLDAVAVRRLRIELRRAAFEAGTSASADELLCSAFANPLEFDLLELPVARRAAAVARALQRARSIAEHGSVEEVIWSLWQASGIESAWAIAARGTGVLAEEANRGLDAVVALQASARRFVERRPSESGNVFLAELLAADLPEDSLSREREHASVLVTTPAALIGRSFRQVIIADLQDGVWPDLRLRNSLLGADQLIARDTAAPADTVAPMSRADVRSDEFRLFALAYSRASDSVLLTAVANDDELPSVLFELSEADPIRPSKQSWTLRGLSAELRRELTSSIAHGTPSLDAAAGLAVLAANGVSEAHPDNWYGLAAPSSTEPIMQPPARVSPSTLEKITDSSLNWFIDRYAPSPSDSSRAIGDIVHAAMEHADPSQPDLAAMEAEVQARWPELHFDAEWQRVGRRAAVSRMLHRVAEYLETAHSAGRIAVGVESAFEFTVDDIVVNGRIDRVERDANGELLVIDLKTGRLAGIPGPIQVKKHLQLQVYQLAVNESAISGVSAGASVGAALLAVDTDQFGGELRRQPPIDATGIDALTEQIQHAASLMVAADFEAAPASGFGFGNARRYRIHVIAGVSE